MTLHLGGDTVTDKGLASVAELTDLRELVIWWATNITDAGVAHLSLLRQTPHGRYQPVFAD